MTADTKKTNSMRRSIAKTLVGLSVVLPIFQFVPIGRFISVQIKTIKVSRESIANTKAVAVNKALVFKYPTEDRPAMLIHLGPGEYPSGNYWEKVQMKKIDSDLFVAYDVICTHLGCPVGWIENERSMGPSCHGARFSPLDGTVQLGPPPRPLPRIKLEITANGDIYANGYEGGLPLMGLENVELKPE